MAKTRKTGAIELLKQDHREVEALFKEFQQLDEAGDGAVAPVIATACAELKIHDIIESEIFYPAVRQQAAQEEVEDLLNEAEVEHNSVRGLIQTIQAMDLANRKRLAHFTVLMEYVKHHVKEEEKEMFPKIKKLDLDLQTLGERMKERKAELMREMGIEVTEESEDQPA
jgi:hemerythrin superfamily protein